MNVNIEAAIAILMISFFVLVIIRLPVTFALIISTVLTMLYCKIPLMTMVQQMSKAVNSFSLLAIPFFILMGEIMGAGGISSRLLEFANVCVGHLRGGLAHVNILASMFFGGISGSAVADVSSLGTLEIPMMEKAGYDRPFATAVTVSSACQGLIIPPSHNMVLYSMAAGGISVGRLFWAGYAPGILLGVCLMILCWFMSIKRNYPKGERVPLRHAVKVTREAFFAIFAMVIIVGGVSCGLFTATESAAIACIYSFLVSMFIYKELKMRHMPKVLSNTVKTLAMVYSLIAAAGAFSWILAYLRIPARVTDLLLGISDNRFVVLILINLILLFLGCIMDMAPLVLIMTPILLPVVQKFGMTPIQFGIVLMLNLGIGLCTPPVGSCLFAGCAIGKISIEETTKALLPMYVVMVVALLLITFIPAITMTLPNIVMP